jgi:type I restriction enzyme M protein
MPANLTEIEKKLWSSADELRANSNLKSSEYSVPVLGLIFRQIRDLLLPKLISGEMDVERLEIGAKAVEE